MGLPGTSWTIDDAGKSLVLDRWLESGGPWLAYPGRGRDPELRFFPQPLTGRERYAAVLPDGRILSQYTSPFLVLAAPFAAVARDGGRAVLPALGGGACVALAGWLAGRAGASRRGVLLASGITALATPFVFYSSVFWEHTLAAALATGALVALLDRSRERPVLAGMLAGGAVFLREEMLLFAGAIAIAMTIARRQPRSVVRFVLACVPGAGALLLWNVAIAGTLWGVHVEANRPSFGSNAPRALASILFDAGFARVPILVTAALFALLAASRWIPARPPFRPRLLDLAALAALLVVSALAFVRFPGTEDQALALLHSNSMLVAIPWALVALLPRGRDDLSAVASLVFLLLFAVLVPARSITGVHPGPRMLLPILPALAAATAAHLAWSRDRPRTVLLVALLAVGVLWSARSLVLLHEKREASGRIASVLAADPRRIIVTDLFWLPTELSFLEGRKEFHLVSSSSDLAALSARCAADGEREILYVTSTGAIRNRAPLAAIVNPGFAHFSVELHVVRP